MPNSQKGFVPLVIVVVVLLGLVSTVFLVKNGQNFFPSAQQQADYVAPNRGETSFALVAAPSSQNLIPTTLELHYKCPEGQTDMGNGSCGGGQPNNDPAISQESTSNSSSQVDYANRSTNERRTPPYPIPTLPPFGFYAPGQEFSVDVVVRADITAAHIFKAYLNFPTNLAEVVRIEPKMSDAGSCEGFVYACVTEQVYCIKAPCPPRQTCQQFPSCKVPDGWTTSPQPKDCSVETAQMLKGREYHSSRIIVGFKEGTTEAQMQALMAQFNLNYQKIGDDFNVLRAVRVDFKQDSVINIICAFQKQGSVAYAEPDYLGSVGGGTDSQMRTGTASEGNARVDEQATSAIAQRIAKRTLPNTVITHWTTQNYDNAAGKITLEGETKGGLLTRYNQPPVRMATIVFKAKAEGKSQITFNDNSQIYGSDANSSILVDKNNRRPFTLSIQKDSGGVACPAIILDCAPGYMVAPDYGDANSKTTDAKLHCPKYKCVPEKTVLCNEPMPSCAPGQQGVTSYNVQKDCSSYSCVTAAPEGTPPPVVACNLAVPSCPNGQTIINNGAGADGCPSYTCVFTGDQQVPACDPSKSIIYGDFESGDGRIICSSGTIENPGPEISYSFGDFNKDGVVDFKDVTYFFSPNYWQRPD